MKSTTSGVRHPGLALLVIFPVLVLCPAYWALVGASFCAASALAGESRVVPLSEDAERTQESDRPPGASQSSQGSRLLDLERYAPLKDWRGPLAFVVIAAATLISEDLTCIAVGLMAATGRVDFWFGAAACFVGIYLGDMGLFWAGRLLGRPVLRLPPLRWLIRSEDLERSSRWLRRNGPVVIAVSRFVPGTRLPTYLVAGMLETRFVLFALYFLPPAAIWTPLLIALAMYLGGDVANAFQAYERYGVLGLGVTVLFIWAIVRVLAPIATRLGRRRLSRRLKRLRRWEFWPVWVFYPPIVAYILWLGIRFRSPTLFTCCNPAIPSGGVIGESKAQILEALAPSGQTAVFSLIPAGVGTGEGRDRVEAFLRSRKLEYPVVLKPERGERGSGVSVVRSPDETVTYFKSRRPATIVQQFVPGLEYGLFYVRRPGDDRGRIFSLSRKVLPEVTGDGESTVEELVLSDERASIIAAVYARQLGDRFQQVPPAGARVPLTELGTHCRGAVFLEGSDLQSLALEEEIDRISQTFEGFYFGRYDLRAASDEALRRGRFKILELNGVSSEAAHVYDPRYSLIDAYRTLMLQWRLAFQIGRANRDSGVRPLGLWKLLRLIVFRRHEPSNQRPQRLPADQRSRDP